MLQAAIDIETIAKVRSGEDSGQGRPLAFQQEDPNEYFFHGIPEKRVLDSVTFMPDNPEWINLMSGVHRRELVAESEMGVIAERTGLDVVSQNSASELPEHCKSANFIMGKAAKLKDGELNLIALCASGDPTARHVISELFGTSDVFAIDPRIPEFSKLRLASGLFCDDKYTEISAVLFVHLPHLRYVLLGFGRQELSRMFSDANTTTLFINPFASAPLPSHTR